LEGREGVSVSVNECDTARGANPIYNLYVNNNI